MRTIADGLEWSYGWEAPAAQRLRFVLDFDYATGLRASELVSSKFGDVETDRQGDHWLNLIGKGSRVGKVALPPLARGALDRYLVERGLPVTRARWNPKTLLVGGLGLDPDGGITGTPLWSVVKRFFETAADTIENDQAVLAEKLRKSSPHWMRHTYATHALGRGAELTTFGTTCATPQSPPPRSTCTAMRSSARGSLEKLLVPENKRLHSSMRSCGRPQGCGRNSLLHLTGYSSELHRQRLRKRGMPHTFFPSTTQTDLTRLRCNRTMSCGSAIGRRLARCQSMT